MNRAKGWFAIIKVPLDPAITIVLADGRYLTGIRHRRDNVWTVPDDVQTTFDLIPGEDKKLHWIQEGDTRRFISHNFFGDHPESMIAFFDKHMN